MSVYVIDAPHRENFLAKEDRIVVGGAACSGSNQRPPPGVTACPDVSGVFAMRELSNNHHNPASLHECNNTRLHHSAAAAHTAER
jgi:hypothetical protein